MNKYQLLENFILPLSNVKYNSTHYTRITPTNTFGEQTHSHVEMNRDQWLQSATYLLEGIFKYVKDIEAPLLFPKQKGKSYPKILKAGKKMAHLEGVCRTLFIATPVLIENPDLVLNNIRVADYYRNQITRLLDPSSSAYIQDRNTDYPTQFLVEFGGLAISFFLGKKVLWTPLEQNVKDKLALKMLSYANGPYVDNNWKYFSVFILSFLQSEGYEVDENRLKKLLEKIIEDYSGEGWYLDDSYDYYSMWGYQLYAVIWCRYYGEKHHPEIAERLKKNFTAMLSFYPNLFARDGKMLMWGRSITYRFGAAAPFVFASWNDAEHVNYGWLRRISSGTLQQFLNNADFLHQSIPALGFYGPFEPGIQGYSCRASSFWLGKAYLGLSIPPDNSFWTEKENDGPWETYKARTCHSYYSEASKILVTHYSEIGEAEIRTSTPRNIRKAAEYMRNENYNRLSYHTAFPWQADTENGCVAMNYLIKESDNVWEPLRQYEHVSYDDGILRRRVSLETYKDTSIDLVDIPIPNGVLRIDRITTSNEKHIRLGHYALCQKKDSIKESSIPTDSGLGTAIDNGQFQLLVIPVAGWESVRTIYNKGIHPESDKSAVLNLLSKVQNSTILITLMMFRKSGEDWQEELDIIDTVEMNGDHAKVLLKNNKQFNWEWKR